MTCGVSHPKKQNPGEGKQIRRQPKQMVPVEPFDRVKGALSMATAKPQTPPPTLLPLNSQMTTWPDAATGGVVQHPCPILDFRYCITLNDKVSILKHT